MEFRGREALSGVATLRSDGGDELVRDAAVVDEAMASVGDLLAADGDALALVRGSGAVVHDAISWPPVWWV